MNDSLVVTVLELLMVVALVAAIVEYVRVPYTVALVLTGLVLSLLPEVPRVTLTPGLILTVFARPAAALDTRQFPLAVLLDR